MLFNLRYLESCKGIACISDSLYYYDFVNSNSLVHSYRENNFEIATLLYERMIEFGINNRVSQLEMYPVRNVYINSVFYAIQDLFYYSPLQMEEKKEKLKKWMRNKHLKECLDNGYKGPKQKELICMWLKKEKVNAIVMFFKTKKLVSKIKGLVK